MTKHGAATPFVDMPRSAWAELAAATSVVLSQSAIDKLRGIGDPTSELDVQEVYHPLAELIGQYARNTGQLYRDSNAYLGLDVGQTPFVIAIAGSVAVGKSTVARLVAELLTRSYGHPKVELVTTDGFLYPSSVLTERGIMERKGFPESYDTRALLQFVIDVKSGVPKVKAPVYSHAVYDILPGEFTVVNRPDILVLEGLNVLQPWRFNPDRRQPILALSDFVDFSVYVDADEADIREWFICRFMKLRGTAASDPDSFFRQFADMTEAEAYRVAEETWDTINGPNLRENIAPTRQRATVILRKGHDHSIESVRIRKI